MASDDEIQEGVEDVEEDENFDSLRGTTVYDDDHTIRNALIGGSTFVVFALMLTYYLIRQYTLTPEDILQDDLKKPQRVVEMLEDASFPVRTSTVKKQELMDAVTLAVKLGTTPLRLTAHPQAPHVPEREEAFIVALEGLQRLELEGFLDFDKHEDRQFYDTTLTQLGRQRLQYYEHGVLERIPLMQIAWLREEIKGEQERSGYLDERLIKSLTDRLEAAEATESFTIVSPAYLLGLWYRFYNEKKFAERCFQIGRQYVDGYNIGYRYIPGRKLDLISPLWDAYAGCLEALAEDAFDKKKFRQARSYLIRIFDTPRGVNVSYLGRGMAEQIADTKIEINRLHRDTALIEKVLGTVSGLPSFPFLHSNDSIIEWKELLEEISVGYSASGVLATDYVWERLERGVQERIQREKSIRWLTLPIKQQIMGVFNELIKDPTFYQRVTFENSQLSEKGQSLLLKSETASLTANEYMFLNRDIFDSTFTRGIVNKFLLSDGTRLNNALELSQISLLIQLRQEEIDRTDTEPRRRNELRKEVNAIFSGEKEATLFDLQTILKEKVGYLKQIIDDNEKIFDEQRTSLSNVLGEVKELEERGGVNVSRIIQLHKQEELARNRQQEAKIRIKQLNGDLEGVNAQLADLNSPFRDRLDQFKIRLTRMLVRQNQLRDRNLTERGPLISQIEEQIELRGQYMTLLNGLKEKGQHTILQQLDQEKTEVLEQITEVTKNLSLLSGNARENLEIDLKVLRKREHELVKDFNKLYDPLRTVVESISAQEEEIWKTEELLKDTREEISKIIGRDDQIGLLEEKTRRRASLLLMQPQEILDGANYSQEIIILNAEISKFHASLQALLQTEKFAQTTLEAFYPYAGEYATFSLREGDLAKLEEYLDHQTHLMEEYGNIWKQQVIRDDLYREQSVILENMKLISTRLAISSELSEAQINDLSRYMENILLARKAMSLGSRELKALIGNEDLKKGKNQQAIGGHYLDSLEVFQMEQAMGFNVTEYRRAFEERKLLLAELQPVLGNKKRLEGDKLDAVRRRDQVRVDVILPKILELERNISILSQRENEINDKLRGLAEEYSSRMERVEDYRVELRNGIVGAAEGLGGIHRSMVENDEQLNGLSKEIFWTASEFSKTITSLSVGDLKGIDELIHQQKIQLERLHQVHNVKLREDSYKAKSLWLIGKSLEEQSRLKAFDDLIVSNELPPEMLEQESRVGQLIVNEFNPTFVYSEEMFGPEGELADGGNVNFDTWIDFLEETALNVFHEELPNYVITRTESGMGGGSEGNMRDNNAIIARSRFLSGEIYMKRALRFIRSSRAEVKANDQARKELDAAMRSFLSYLDFATSLSRESSSFKDILTETMFGTQEFPVKVRKPVNLVDQARINLGVIAFLKGDYHESILHDRQILTDMVKDLPGIELENSDLPVGQIDPILLEQFQYDLGVHPLYASLMAHNPHSHEVLYRLGRNYSALANEAYEEEIKNSLVGGVIEVQKDHEAIDEYTYKAMAYFSQLILTQSYSPYRRAATLQRGLLRKMVGDYENARRDLVAVLGSPYDSNGSLNHEDMTVKGDLPGELNPGYSYIAFELGKLYFDNQDYEGAADIFRRAQEGDPGNTYVLKARIAYAQALMKTSKWLIADYFLSELAEEKDRVMLEKEHYYHADILVDLGFVRKELFNYENALGIFRAVFRDYAPVELLDSEGELSLMNIRGLAILETDYRDSIRPLAMSCLHSAEIYLTQRKYTSAKSYFKKAQSLFRMIRWREDRILRELNKREFEIYRKSHILQAEWGHIKSDILDLAFSTFEGYRRLLARGLEPGQEFDPDDALARIDKVMLEAGGQRESYVELLKAVDDLYVTEQERLPETVEGDRVRNIRSWDRKIGGQQVRVYDALVRVRDFTIVNVNLSPLKFMGEILKQFTREGIEDSMINEFTLEFAKGLQLTPEDRKDMIPMNNNIDNLMEIDKATERLANFAYSLKRWIEQRMRATGIDDVFVPVSAQAEILEEVDLYRASLHSFLDDFENYGKLVEIAQKHLNRVEQFPNRIQSPITVWQIVELASMGADFREDWANSEQLHEYILRPDQDLFFAQADGSDKIRAKLAYARALFQVGRERFNEVAFIQDEVLKKLEQKKTQDKLDMARSILEELVGLEDGDGIQITARIRAKELLNELNTL
ncbi:MAG: hypothetical protein ACI9S8_000637 [Chlamydiales bacterium]|jgi:hypothetical protein